MTKTSLTRALFLAGVLGAAGGLAQADAIFYPDGSHVELGANGVENGMADSVLARSSSTAPDSQTLASLGLSDQSAPMVAMNDDSMDIGPNTTTLGAGPSNMSSMTTTTVTTTTPVYVFPNINFDRTTVLSQPHPMLSRVRTFNSDRMAAATFDTPTRAGEASTMTGGAPNMLTSNERLASVPPSILVPNTTTLGAGPAVIVPDGSYVVPSTTILGYGPSNQINPNTGSQQLGVTSNCPASSVDCHYLPD
jgi:hypothetical protein